MSFSKHSLLPQGALIEMNQIGNSIKVMALDPVTATEVSIVGSALASQKELEDLAIKKLVWVLQKKLNEKNKNVGGRKITSAPSGWDL